MPPKRIPTLREKALRPPTATSAFNQLAEFVYNSEHSRDPEEVARSKTKINEFLNSYDREYTLRTGETVIKPSQKSRYDYRGKLKPQPSGEGWLHTINMMKKKQQFTGEGLMENYTPEKGELRDIKSDNAYQSYRGTRFPLLREKYPNKSQYELNETITGEWSSLSQEQKDFYKNFDWKTVLKKKPEDQTYEEQRALLRVLPTDDPVHQAIKNSNDDELFDNRLAITAHSFNPDNEISADDFNRQLFLAAQGFKTEEDSTSEISYKPPPPEGSIITEGLKWEDLSQMDENVLREQTTETLRQDLLKRYEPIETAQQEVNFNKFMQERLNQQELEAFNNLEQDDNFMLLKLSDKLENIESKRKEDILLRGNAREIRAEMKYSGANNREIRSALNMNTELLQTMNNGRYPYEEQELMTQEQFNEEEPPERPIRRQAPAATGAKSMEEFNSQVNPRDERLLAEVGKTPQDIEVPPPQTIRPRGARRRPVDDFQPIEPQFQPNQPQIRNRRRRPSFEPIEPQLQTVDVQRSIGMATPEREAEAEAHLAELRTVSKAKGVAVGEGVGAIGRGAGMLVMITSSFVLSAENATAFMVGGSVLTFATDAVTLVTGVASALTIIGAVPAAVITAVVGLANPLVFVAGGVGAIIVYQGGKYIYMQYRLVDFEKYDEENNTVTFYSLRNQNFISVPERQVQRFKLSNDRMVAYAYYNNERLYRLIPSNY